MPRRPTISPADLPQTGDTWLFAVRKLRTWIVPEEKEPYRPFFIITYNRNQDLIQGAAIIKKTSQREAGKALLSAMTHSPKGSKIEASRPARIGFEDKELLEALRSTLQEIGVQAAYYPRSEEIDFLVKDLESRMRDDQPEIPGLLSGKGLTIKMAGALFEAAANFYQEAPWIQLSDEEPLAIKIPPKENWTYATVMGQGGIEYGLAYYQDWADVERMYLPHDDPMEIIPAGGTRSLLFSPVIDLPFDDVEDIEKYGWTLAGPQAYPFPAIFRTSDQVERPDRDEVLWYEAVLRAIPEFVRDHLKKNADGEIQPVSARIIVSTAAGLKNVEIKYPAGQLPFGQMTAENFFDEEEVDTDAETIPFDLRGMEGQLAHLSERIGTSFFDQKTKKAQEIMYEAWDELNPARRLTLAHQALKQSENCADAYVLLAEEAAASVDEALDYYEKGVAAGERALGIEFFKENKGHFWAILETRPYMRALEGKADCLCQLKQKQEALQTYQEMLHLNPNDNQGIRYILTDLLLDMNREEEVEKLLKKYKQDYSATWLYTRALMTWRKNGPSAVAERTLKRAVEENPYVLDYLTGKKRIPNMKPDSITWGGDSEAVDYAGYHLNHWRKTAGAIEWLKSQQQKTRSTKRTPPKRARNESKKQGTI